MKFNLSIAAMAAAFLAWSSGPLRAYVVTDNNLVSSTVSDLSSSNNLVSTPIDVSGGKTFYALKGTFASTVTGIDLSNYYIAGISSDTPPASASDLLGFLKWGRTNGQAYPAKSSTILFAANPATTTAYLSLGMGAFEGHKAAGYSWSATGLKLYSAAGIGGNIVPNASFEDANINFWSGTNGGSSAGSFVSNPGKQGSTVWQITSPANSYLALPVTVGQTYTFSFWSASPDIGSGHQISYGFAVPVNGFASTGSGDTLVTRYSGGGDIGWTEYTGTFTPEEGQTIWYLGGMANGGALQFDSIYVAPIPEPSAGLMLLIGGAGLLALGRRR